MKKIMLIILCFVLLSAPSAARAAEQVTTTDIKAFIDGLWVPGVNVGGRLYVYVRDLENYGYAVEWNGEQRRVDLYKADNKTVLPLLPEYVGAENSGRWICNTQSTDITVYFGGIPIPSVSINGKTAVMLRDIDIRCNISFNSQRRESEIWVGKTKFEGKKLEYKNIFYSCISLLSRGDYEADIIMSMAESDVYNEAALYGMKKYIEELTAANETLKKYEESPGFSESAMELWWASVNARYAACNLYEMAENMRDGISNPVLKDYYLQYAEDSRYQRSEALALFASEL